MVQVMDEGDVRQGGVSLRQGRIERQRPLSSSTGLGVAVHWPKDAVHRTSMICIRQASIRECKRRTVADGALVVLQAPPQALRCSLVPEIPTLQGCRIHGKIAGAGPD